MRGEYGGGAAVERVVVPVEAAEGLVPLRERPGSLGEGRAVKRVEHTVHARLVAVIDRGHARDGELHHGRQALHGRAARVLAVAHEEARLLLAGHAPRVEPRREGRARALHVVGAEQVHERVVHGQGVVEALLQEEALERPGVGAEAEEIQHRAAEGVVHDRIQGRAEGVAAARAVGELRRRVLPDLAEYGGLGVLRLGGGAYLLERVVGELVGHVQAPAGRAAPQPGPDDAVLAGDDELFPARVVLVHLGEVGEVPPAAVLLRPLREVVPAVEGRIFPGVIGPVGAVVVVAVEVYAVRARVGEDAVEHYAYPALLRRGHEALEVLERAEDGVGLHVVAGVVAVVAAGVDNRVEVYGTDAEALEVAELLLYAAEGAAEEVEGEVEAVLAVRLPVHRLVPALVVFDLAAHGDVPLDAAPRGVA